MYSQLAQSVREVQKSLFSDSTRVISLGSRQNLCINEQVKSLKIFNRIYDRCLELQKKDKGGCSPELASFRQALEISSPWKGSQKVISINLLFLPTEDSYPSGVVMANIIIIIIVFLKKINKYGNNLGSVGNVTSRFPAWQVTFHSSLPNGQGASQASLLLTKRQKLK